MKRKHRVVVDVLFDRPTTAKNAKRIVESVLESVLERSDSLPQIVHEESVRHGVNWTHYTVKEGERVIRAEARKLKSPV